MVILVLTIIYLFWSIWGKVKTNKNILDEWIVVTDNRLPVWEPGRYCKAPWDVTKVSICFYVAPGNSWPSLTRNVKATWLLDLSFITLLCFCPECNVVMIFILHSLFQLNVIFICRCTHSVYCIRLIFYVTALWATLCFLSPPVHFFVSIFHFIPFDFPL